MIIFRKAALSLLISMLLFAVFTTLAFTGLFDLVEARFYNPAVVRALGREIDADAQVIEEFFGELQARFAVTLDEGAVRRSFLSGMESEDIALRASLYGELLESLGGLQSVRFIDSGGRRIHFSTWPPDILRRDRNSIAYRNYDAQENSAAYIPYGQVEAAAPRLILDGPGERIVFSFPLYDSFDLYRGTALFSLSVRGVMDRMVNAGRIKVGEEVSVVSEPPGLVTGLPPVGRNVLLPLVARMWSENSLSLGALNSDLTGVTLALISRKMEQNIYIGRLVNQSLLSFPLAMRIILLISFLVTVFLIIFLIGNFRQDDITIIQSRLKKLQINVLEEYYEHTGELHWNRWKKELEHRREDLHAELKRGLNTRTLAEIDSFIDRSWDDLMAIIGGRLERRSGIDEDTLKALLRRLLPETTPAPPYEALDKAGGDESEEIEALNEADIADALEGPARKVFQEAPEPEWEELEVEELELAESEGDEPETSGDTAGKEAPEPDLEELEAVELEPVEPDEANKPDAPGDPAGAPEPAMEELEVEELEAAELEPVEPEAPEEANKPDAPGDPAGAPEPAIEELEVEELEAVELEPVEPDEPEAMTGFYGVDPLANEDSNEAETALDNLVSAIEFSPESKESEMEKEEAAKSMAEHFEIQSPFASIFSALSEAELEPEPVENLESLEREGPPPEDSPETEAEELRLSFAGPLLSRAFLGTLNGEVAVLTAEDEEAEELETERPPEEAETGEPVMEAAPEETEPGGVVTERDGVIYINENILNPDKAILKGLDRNFKNLIDSVLNRT